jgi:hypothetical protein
VDGGTHLDHPGWLEAGQLQPGDELRTVAGKHVTVTALHWNVGDAEVYTLTVARDHTFFVGTARVLVHNATCPTVSLGVRELVTDFSIQLGGSPYRAWWSYNIGSWPQEFRSTINAANEIHFLLSLRDGKEIDVAAALASVKADPVGIRNPFMSNIRVTNWELYQLSLPENAAALARTKFFIKTGFDTYTQVPVPAALGAGSP